MTLYYAKALIIYFWKPVAAITGILFASLLADYISRERRAKIHIEIREGSIELLKWLSAFLMLIDHTNKYLFDGSHQMAFYAGRLVMPIFAVVFAYNLARFAILPTRIYWRLLAFGAIACVPLFLLQPISQWLPLNVLFMLLLGALIIQAINFGRWYLVGALLLFVIGGAFVEYWWPGLAVMVGSYYFFKNKSLLSLALVFLGMFFLFYVNHNYWAFASIPLIFICACMKVELKRYKWFFYAFYPLHLMAIYAVSALAR